MKTREEIQTDILMGADAPAAVGVLTVRPVTFASLLVLRKLGNPLARSLERGGAVAADNLEAIAEFLWVQCAPWETVKRMASGYTAGEGRQLLNAAVLEFAAQLTPQQIKDTVQAIAAHGEQLGAVTADVIPDKDAPAGAKN